MVIPPLLPQPCQSDNITGHSSLNTGDGRTNSRMSSSFSLMRPRSRSRWCVDLAVEKSRFLKCLRTLACRCQAGTILYDTDFARDHPQSSIEPSDQKTDSDLQTTFDKLAKDAHDEPGIMRSKGLFEGIIKGEVDAGIPSNKIILGGFSQGGAVSLFTGLTTTYKLGGVFGLSSYLLLGEKIKTLSTEANKDTPFFMGHGTDDPLVKYEWGTGTVDAIKELGRKVEFKSYKYAVFRRAYNPVDHANC